LKKVKGKFCKKNIHNTKKRRDCMVAKAKNPNHAIPRKSINQYSERSVLVLKRGGENPILGMKTNLTPPNLADW